MRHLTVALVLMCAVVRGTARSQTPAARSVHVIAGRVTTDSGSAIQGADVIVTIAPSADIVAGKSDSTGAYRVIINDPTGEYLLYIAALGRQPFRQRVNISRPDTVAIVNVRLAAAVSTMAAVRVQERKVRPPRLLGSDGPPGNDIGDKTADGVSGALPPDLQNTFDAIAGTIPGLSVTAVGVSAFGLGADANATVLNGLSFAGNDLPRDARTSTRFRTSPWDPTVGGFSGVQMSVALAPGGNVATRRGHATLDAPALQFSAPVAGRLGQRFTNLAIDEGGVGAYALDKLFYNFGVHAARQMAPVASLGDLDAAALTHAGLSPDSAARVVALLDRIHIPVKTSHDERTTSTVSFIERVDRAPSPSIANGPPGSTLALTGFGRYSQSDATTLGPTVTAAFAGRSTSAMVGAQGLYSRYFGHDGDYVSETTSGLTFARTRGRPYAALPSAQVIVASEDGVGAASFGGNSALDIANDNWTWETINQTGFLLNGHPSLPVKLYLQSRLDWYNQAVSANRLGRFTYASVADLAANRPSTFSRALDVPDRRGGEWLGAGAFGGNYIRNNLTLTGGFRVDANVFTVTAPNNADLERLFDVRTGVAPNSVSLSPRLGFNWRYRPTIGYTSLNTGMAALYRGAAELRGGIGKFRGTLPATLLADARALTGLPGSTRQLLCVGSAAPVPDWSAYAADSSAIPNACGSASTVFADTAAAVALVARSFVPSESWRANVGWTTSQFLASYVSVDASYSRTDHLGSTVDLNFAGAAEFTLDDERRRPVFVTPQHIVASTGAVSTLGARRVAQYGSVSERVSDLRGNARQLSAYVIPNLPFTAGVVIASYTYTDARSQTRGFDASTSGDPRTVEWSPSSLTPRHTIIVQAARNFFDARVGASAMLRATSGLPFTPTVAGDINGDAASNDRAFIFNPATATDPTVGTDVSRLLSAGPAAARDCLRRQLGTIAGRNSCVGPWGATLNANVVIFEVPHTGGRTRVVTNFTNVAGGIDQLLHGSGGLHGWGNIPLADPLLLQVRGFDEARSRFLYHVNPRFGSTSPATTVRLNPFRITLDVQTTLGRSAQEQSVEQNLRVRPSLVGTRASADTIKARYLRTAGTDIYAQMMRFSDSLALSRDQVERMRAQQKRLGRAADSIYTGLAQYLVALPPKFNAGEAAKRVNDARAALWQVIYAERGFVRATLTAGQVRLLPTSLRDMVMSADYRGMFFAGGFSSP